MDRATYRGNTHPIAAQAVVRWLPKDRRSRPSMGCPLLGRPVNRNCPIVPYLAATALDMPTMCLPLTEGELARRPFYLETIPPVNTLAFSFFLSLSPFYYNRTCRCLGTVSRYFLPPKFCHLWPTELACRGARWMHRASKRSTRKRRWLSSWKPAAVSHSDMLCGMELITYFAVTCTLARGTFSWNMTS